MKLRIGIVGKETGWHQILAQIGVPYSRVHDPQGASDCSVLVAGNELTNEEVVLLQRYLGRGGSVLCSGQSFSRMTRRSAHTFRLSSLFPAPNSPFAGIEVLDVPCVAHVSGFTNQLSTQNAKPTTFIGPFGGGRVLVLPFDPSLLVLDQTATRRSFYSHAPKLPHERVSSISKGGLRCLVQRSLVLLHHDCALPFIHTSPIPSEQGNIFTFRIDTDDGDRTDIERLYTLIRRCGIPATWFLHVRAQNSFLSVFSEMENQEIGIHCHEHREHRRSNRIRTDIDHAMEELTRAGISVFGYAAPYGGWSDNLGTILCDKGFEYSSEFSYDYDNVPSFPILANGKPGVLQLPIHPISIGSLRRQGYSGEDLRKYFRRVIDRNIACSEPVCLYHHPKDGHENILEWMFDYVRERGAVANRMIDYAHWWRQRMAVRWNAEVQNNTITLDVTPDTYMSVTFRITTPDGRQSIIKPQQQIELSKLEGTTPASPVVPADIERIRTWNKWIIINRFEDILIGKPKTFFRRLYRSLLWPFIRHQ